MVNKSHTRISEGFDKEGFHARLKGIIGGETQASFAKRIGISQAGLHRIVNGGIPGLDIAYAISVAANVSLDWLAAGPSRRKEEDGPSHATVTPIPPLDAILLTDVIAELERWLQEKNSELQPSKKAEAIQKIYEYVLEEAGENSVETRHRDIRRLLKLVV